jgi:hypothetical protein
LETLREAWEMELETRFGVDRAVRRPILDAMWRNFEEIHEEYDGERVSYLQSLDALTTYDEDLEEAKEELVRLTKDDDLFPFLIDVHPPKTSSGSVRPEESSKEGKEEYVDLGQDIELEWPSAYTGRASALSEYIAKILAVDPDVMRFRNRLLGDPLRVISREEANKLVRSPASHIFDPERFRKLCMPLDEKEIVLEKYGPVQENGRLLLRASISVESPGITKTMEKLHPSQDPLVTFVWPWVETERPETFQVWPNSVVGELQRISLRLAKEHPWSAEAASLFILTGEVLWVSPLSYWTQQTGLIGTAAHKYEWAEITLTIAPWVKEKVVLEAHRKIKRSLGYKDGRWEPRNVAVFRFVLQQSKFEIVKKPRLLGRDWRAKLILPAWKELRRQWNEKYPVGNEWHYGQNDPHAKIFRRDFVSGQEVVIGTRYGLPGVLGTPMTRAEEQRMVEGWLGTAECAQHQEKD